MELELGLKITRIRDDVSSSTDFRVSRDSLGQVSLSRETNSVFILILHLKGFKREGIDIDINKEGNRLKISGRKQVEEMVLIKWMEWKKEVEIKQCNKVFKIPDIVILDKIKARFSEEDGILTVTLPKKVKGITGLKIEEEEKEEEKTEPVEEKTEPEEEIKEEIKPKEEEKEAEEPQKEEEEEKIEEDGILTVTLPKKVKGITGLKIEEEEKEEEKTEPVEEKTEPEEEIKEEIKPKEEEKEAEEPQKEEEEEKIEEEVLEEETRDHEEEKEESKPKKKRRKKCRFPLVAGSTLLMSIIAFIIQFIQSRRK